MSDNPSDLNQLTRILSTVRRRWRMWTIPAVVSLLLATAYGLLASPQWTATQSLWIRDEAINEVGGRLGRFESTDAMQVAQKTVLEVVFNRSVLRAALEQVGPEESKSLVGRLRSVVTGDRRGTDWPRANDVTSLASSLEVKAPNGAEFGRTEVIYLSVSAGSRGRAVDLTNALCDQLDQRLRQMRAQKYDGIIREVENTVATVTHDLQNATKAMREFEEQFQGDLGELQMLVDSYGGANQLNTTATEVRSEIRQSRVAIGAQEQQLELLRIMQQNPGGIVATPNDLLADHPSLRRLKDGLVDAQLAKSTMLGHMSREHPKVQAAVHAEQEIREHLRRELDTAVLGTLANLRASQARFAELEDQLRQSEARLRSLASERTTYGNLLAAVNNRAESLERAQADLSAARANKAAARASSLLSRLDVATANNRPDGPSLATVVGVGLVGGLVIGFGALYVSEPRANRSRGRRWTDYASAGRRGEDLTTMQRKDVTGRRASDLGIRAGDDRFGGGARPSPDGSSDPENN